MLNAAEEVERSSVECLLADKSARQLQNKAHAFLAVVAHLILWILDPSRAGANASLINGLELKALSANAEEV